MPSYPRPTRVPPTPLSAVASRVDAAAQGDASITVTGVTLVSADVRPGDLYAAVPGARRHGAEFVPAAVAAGAVAVLTDPAGARMLDTDVPVLVVDDPRAALGGVSALVYGEPSGSLTVLGVTGTAGKTSTVYLLEAGLRAAGVPAGLIGTVETRLGDLVVDSARTTPEAPDLHALFAAAVERGIRAVAMEVSSHALSLGRVSGVRFAVGGFTNFGLDHLDFHPDVDDYFAAKARLFDGRSAVEVINLDDPALKGLIHSGTVTYSAAGDPAATWRAADVTGSGYAQRFTAVGPSGAVSAGVSLPGRHNVANALLAIATLAAAGVDPQVAADGVASCPGVPGRMERVGQIGPVLGVVDYAHKPDAIRAVLAALREVADASGGRIICVLGAGGDRDQGKRPVMGEAAAAGADLLIVTDDNPRTEDPARIRAQVLAGVVTGEAIEIAGRRDAIAAAVERARPGDVVALLGKGHERGQEVGGEVLPFDDRVELAAALAARPDANISGAGVAQ
ncbi:UDP-N-acetylmuramoyl-L-alanyl-D-glutamate--2,6-diaminopimelate ligase [Virgisporangium aliadipatigenens]|uniref:UDP-N-acetylmuramoyl-L-alanyl-D-glutamate--2,6-diaminopimelate ligase n=1 Tax=Virgisporangium aliadipatigenens TaxID=741659 RepID=A0A8J3YU90_9ACTN|nr:UDP-N-acetylmuramoyl-L-alanyl-D-glutamate--2,6-diaminopimelate ligase [Virgisporangium aliadipatigenens]GIJ49911.1 UDP-N-acetylmuramoyl-L-alanyl-D-glutamate--2,6-diaminopimelate ligase [Virgisporangium aliadipatigenens]